MARRRGRASARYLPLGMRDDAPVRFAGVVDIEFDTSDANANCLFIDLPTGGAVDVPVVLLGLADADFGYFAGWTQPTMALEDADGDGYVALTFSANNSPQLTVGGECTTFDIDALVTNTSESGISFTATTTTTGTGHTGWALGFFGSTNLSSTSGVCGSAAGGVFEVNMTSSFVGSTSGIVAGAYIGAYGNSTSDKPTAGLFIETIAGTGVSFAADGSNTDMPIIALVTSGAGTESSLAIEFGSEAAGKEVTTTSGGMFYQGTIQMKANGTLIYMPTSTVEGTYTTAYLIQSSLATDASSLATGAVILAGGIAVTKDMWLGGGELNVTTVATDIVIKGNTAAALEVYDAATKLLAFDTRNTVSAVEVISLNPGAATLPDGAASTRNGVVVKSFTTTLVGVTGVTTPFDGLSLQVEVPTIAQSGGAVVVDKASTMYIAGAPTAGGSVTITSAIALEIDGGATGLMLSGTTTAINVAACTTGIIFSGVTPTVISVQGVAAPASHVIDMINAYTGMVIETGTYASTASRGITLSATNARPVTFVFDDAGADLGTGNYRSVLSRTYLSVNQTGEKSIRSIQGQLKVADAVDLDIDANFLNAVNAVEGYVELAGATGRTVGAQTRLAAIHGLMQIEGDITLTAGGRVVGLFAELMCADTMSVDGVGSAGVLVDLVDTDHAGYTVAWDVGLDIASGAAATGISIGPCTTTGIDFGLTVGVLTGDGNAALIRGGYAATGGHTTPSDPIVFATANQHAMQFYLSSTAGKFTGIEINAYTSDIATDDDSPTCAIEAVGRSLALGTGTNSIYGIRAEAQALALKYGPRSSYELIAGFFKTGSAINGVVGGRTICAKLDLGLGIPSGEGDYGLFIRNNSEGLIGAGPTRVSSTCQAVHFDGGYENVFSFGEVMNVNYGDAWSLTGSGGEGHIRCQMWNGAAYVTKYIRLYNA